MAIASGKARSGSSGSSRASWRRASLHLRSLLRSGRGVFDLDFLDSPSFGTFTALSGTTFEEVAAERHIPVEVLLAIRESIGSAVATPGVLMLDVELQIVPMIEALLASGYTPDAVERLVRILGDSLRRYVLAGAESFRRYVIEPLGAGLGSPRSARRRKRHPSACPDPSRMPWWRCTGHSSGMPIHRTSSRESPLSSPRRGSLDPRSGRRRCASSTSRASPG